MNHQAILHPALNAIQSLFIERGHLVYGEEVTQVTHALQCATLATNEDAPRGLVLAAFLHDIGHMLHQDAAIAVKQGKDDAHEALGAKWLARWFGPEVHEPVRLHVQAKRYLCTVEQDYLVRLSALSMRTLEIQGGPMSKDEVNAFEQLPFFEDAIRLRRWDEAGKLSAMDTLSINHFMQLAEEHLKKSN